MEGPQFSTLAESNLYRSGNCDVIGITNMPEAKLAREAEMCYATVGYDCWHPKHNHILVESILAVLRHNADTARAMLKHVIPRLAERSYPHGC